MALPVADRLVRHDQGADAADERKRCESEDRGCGGNEVADLVTAELLKPETVLQSDDVENRCDD